MQNKVLIVASTSKMDAPPMTQELLSKTAGEGNCGEAFGSDFFPIVGINSEGIFKSICGKHDLSDDLILIIVSDSKPLDSDFLDYINTRIQSLTAFYILLHGGGASMPGTHQKKITEKCDGHLAKIRVAKNHHTILHSQDSKHALGNGLEMIATALAEEPICVEKFKTGINYLKTKPEYFNPYKESLIHLYKSLNILTLRLDNADWTEANFNMEMQSWSDDKNAKIELVQSKIRSLLYLDANGEHEFVTKEIFLENLKTMEIEIAHQ